MKQPKPATKQPVIIDHEIEPGHHFESEDAGSPSCRTTMLLQHIALPLVVGLVVYQAMEVSIGWIPRAPEVPYLPGLPMLPVLIVFLLLLWGAGHLIDFALDTLARAMIAVMRIKKLVISIGSPRLIMVGVLALVALIAVSPAIVALFDSAPAASAPAAGKQRPPAFTRAATARSAMPAPFVPPAPRIIPVAVQMPAESRVAPLLRHLQRLRPANKPMRRKRRG